MKKKPLIALAFIALLVVGYLYYPKEKYQAPLFRNLGSYHRIISSQVSMAQTFFNQGLIFFYGFQWDESVRSFKEATRLDPDCAICYWGEALSLRYKMDEPVTGQEFAQGKEAIDKAVSLSAKASPVEQYLIHALAQWYQNGQDSYSYLSMMKGLTLAYPQDSDLQALYATGLFFYVKGTDPAADNPVVKEADAVLRASLEAHPDHPALNAMFVYFTEPYSRPADALPSADRLKTLVPGSEHLVHLPSHIYFLTGRYDQGTLANLEAINVYKEYDKTVRKQGFEPIINYSYLHNYDFLRTTASMEGNKDQAVKAARELVQEPFPTWLKSVSSLQWYIPIPYFTELRFGLWDEALKHPKPDEQYGYALGMWHYAQGLALAQKNDLKLSLEHAHALYAIAHRGKTDQNLGERGEQLLKIASSVLYAVLSDKHNDSTLLFDHLLHASKIQDAMPYHEPPAWYFPIRQALGDAYLKWNQPAQAQFMYELDLAQYPMNGWSVYGFEQSLRAQGQGDRANTIHPIFEQSWKHADIPLPVSLFPIQKE